MARPSKKNLKLVGTKEEERQLDDLQHPWSLVYGEFLDLVHERYGWTAHHSAAIDPDKREVKMPYLQSPDKIRKVELPGNLEVSDQLDEHTTGSLCRRIGIPPEDFGLSSEEPFTDEDFDFGD